MNEPINHKLTEQEIEQLTSAIEFLTSLRDNKDAYISNVDAYHLMVTFTSMATLVGSNVPDITFDEYLELVKTMWNASPAIYWQELADA